MRNIILAATLLSASFAFAQYDNNGGSYNSYGGSVWDTPSSKQASTPASESTEATSQSTSDSYSNDAYNTNNNSQYNVNPYGNQGTAQYSVQTYAPNKKYTDRQELYTHTRRGFYFANSLTFGYLYLRYSDADANYNGEYDIEDAKYKGFMMPYYEMRLGASIANWFSIYGGFGVGYGTGTLEYLEDRPSSYNDSHEYFKIDAKNLRIAFLCGGELYPIHDKESSMYGFFVGIGFGFSIDGAFYEETEYRTSSYYGNYTETYESSKTFVNTFVRFEVGKDWWFSRRWSFGVAANYTLGGLDDSSTSNNGTYYSEYDYYNSKDRTSFALHSFGLTLRLTH